MARLTPQVQQGMLTTVLADGTVQTVELDEEVWMRWLRESNTRCFRFRSVLGVFSVRCEHSKYWLADCWDGRRNSKQYLGKTEEVTLEALYETARSLYERTHEEPPSATSLELLRAEEMLYRKAPELARQVSFPRTVSRTSASSEKRVVYDMTLVQRLTSREQEVLQVLASGLTNPEIAKPLGVSTSTVKMHLRHIYYKLSLTRRSELVAYAQHYSKNRSGRSGGRETPQLVEADERGTSSKVTVEGEDNEA